MAKVISLNQYIQQRQQKNSFQPSPRPIWFSDISQAISTIAFKDQELIYRNIRYHYYNLFLAHVNQGGIQDNSYCFQHYLKEHLNLNEPFQITHGVDFSGARINRLSQNDWENIADMIVRISLSHYLNDLTINSDIEKLAHQYSWDQVMVDTQ
ncbi:hypothetical protein [Alkaliphilus crotonatoxidans]